MVHLVRKSVFITVYTSNNKCEDYYRNTNKPLDKESNQI